ncbi:uncharacterized protein LOC132282289 [Cornus florida]|uniref:uncharacterized protein LOC132282289 n=1 Tax=Cornus florida TaxID=4283 RepID=UPI0028A2CFD7|nr:uncharacterized protein LOC132282289 [Cornus florida]
MTVEEVSERPEWHTLQREQERERRRMRDRQRRQSMSLEQREKHLARRRRNYQLRRQRAENAQLDSRHVKTSIAARGELKTQNENQALVADLELSVQCDVVAHVGFDSGQETLNASATKSEGAEGGGQNSAKLPQRLRLSKIRHLARLLNTPVGRLGATHQIGADVAAKENARTNCFTQPWSSSASEILMANTIYSFPSQHQEQPFEMITDAAATSILTRLLHLHHTLLASKTEGRINRSRKSGSLDTTTPIPTGQLCHLVQKRDRSIKLADQT